MKKKTRNLQPWLDYFRLLQSYEEKGFLDVRPGKYDAYVTAPALLALTPDGDASGAPDVARRIRAYAGWKSLEGAAFLKKPFALHVVMDAEPHEPLCTILVTRRRWYERWLPGDRVEVIEYPRGSEP